MPKAIPEKVPALWFLLVKKFYQAYYPNGKPNKADPIWVIKENGAILSAVRLKQLPHCQLLTAMVTKPSHRKQGLGSHLLNHIKASLEERPCYCFALPHLTQFYQANGFSIIEAEQLPRELLSRFISYTGQGRQLIAMHYSS